MDRDHEADKLALAVSLGVLPFAMSILGSWLWPLFNAAGDSTYQQYVLSEIVIGFIGGGALGTIIGATLLWVRKITEQPTEEAHH